ncbi:MAG: nickel-dependent hydrogenase large subunit [Verrucomicrobia bacterium]|nr:nickel-dependent hydrogenase large subunit [Verrucomicrobiota bacterium]
MKFVASIDPVTRLEGHMKVEVTIDTVRGRQQVVDAKAAGTLFRGFENILVGRDPRDAQHITERICGVCPISHAMAAVLALDSACGVQIPTNALWLRNLVMGANFIDSHILHFYLLAIPDYLDGPAKAPWMPTWGVDKRITGATAQTLIGHYVQAIAMRRKAHEMGAIFGGKLPHPPTYLAGGFTSEVTEEHITKFLGYLAELTSFITDVYLPDVELFGQVYKDYLNIGRGPGNLLAFGCFDLDIAGKSKLLRRGRVVAGAQSRRSSDDDDDDNDDDDNRVKSGSRTEPVNLSFITEQVSHSWYQPSRGLNPANGVTSAQYPKPNAYSWLKAPRYQAQPYEVGALARMKVNGDYTGGVSVVDRHRARAQETIKIATAMAGWVAQLKPGEPVYAEPTIPASATSYGLTEAPRGALGHWVRINNGVISHYQVLTPTCWNCSPRDDRRQPGPVEAALIGTPIRDKNQPIEVLRVIHSFDPCLDCAVHVVQPKAGAKMFAVPSFRA